MSFDTPSWTEPITEPEILADIAALPTEDDLPSDDGEPMETPRHRDQMISLIYSLKTHWAERTNYYVSGNMFLYCDPQTRQLWRGTLEVSLTPKALAVLRALVTRSGQVVTKEEFFQSVWNETVVSDDALAACIQELRRALRDDARKPRYIETIHRRGYRFIGKVVSDQSSVVSQTEEVVSRQYPVVSRQEEEARQKAKGKNQKAKVEEPGTEREGERK